MSTPASCKPSTGVQAALCLGALGIVYGDIGTSPLYTMKECLASVAQIQQKEAIMGVLSLMFWSMMFQVTFKYLMFVMRADNRGEGGIFALLALSHPKVGRNKRHVGYATMLILLGAALLFGDGVITPAVTVLGAAEGFEIFNPGLHRYVCRSP